MRFTYPFTVLGGIIATVLSAPIIGDDGNLIARTELESTSLNGREVNPLSVALVAARSQQVGRVPTPLEKRKNERRQDSFGYSDYDDSPEKTRRQFDYNSYVPSENMKRQGGDFGYSNYDDNPEKAKRQFDYDSCAPNDKTKRQSDFGYSDYDAKPEKDKRQFTYGDYAPVDKMKRQDSFGYSHYDGKPNREKQLLDRGDYKPKEEKRSNQVGNFHHPPPRFGMGKVIENLSKDMSVELEQGIDLLPGGKRGENTKRQFNYGYDGDDDDDDDHDSV